jgi:adenylate cyclase
MNTANGKLVPVGGGDSIDLPGETVVIGRRPSCDVRMEFPNISGQHCRLTYREGYWYLEDLESQNGTKVCGTRILPRTNKLVHPGELITIGKRDFKLEYVLGQNASPIAETPLMEDLSIPLMQKAGLERKREQKTKSGQVPVAFDPADFLLQEDLD